ncbi:XTP/dITP diphosphohydrolase [Sporobacter termitidis DSM 10068]|uniref:dITP/XTP pyrophosphatase n=1 Tax=Sporobacter termitidis DSM 10068 TaxID=1123282 RepID=A0A1M5UKL7_9FIRM|nr:RdgB/HAM1 family non-canonical purine NTP pyrophosphatase [Sporobacter termitidis]SHH63460.1 XTP/dITP diphosphohydrolase [Sporobacter termitidis DSM 10068]
MIFVLASNNNDKLKELRAILSGFGYDVVSQSEAGLDLEVEETGRIFYDNAFLKAAAAMKATGKPAVADDSGLMVDFLDGAPGVYSKRFGGGGLDDAGRNRLLLETMAPAEHRGAKFVSSIVCVFPNGDVISAEGTCEGTILHASRGIGGFGYDPVFFVTEMGKSMAELTPEEKNRVSHRGNALRLFAPKLKEYLEKTGEIPC